MTNHAEDEEGIGSSDEALLEMLGLQSLDNLEVDEKKDIKNQSNLPSLSLSSIYSLVELHRLRSQYELESVCIFPQEFSISAGHMRRITEALVWGGDQVQADRTYEAIQVYKNGEIQQRRTLTRLENFVDAHESWSELCHDYLPKILTATLGEKVVLYKEKLNLKPPGGSGFAPHLDTPSLRVALGANGPQDFITVMVASKSIAQV
jgi:hypothetical protein